MIDVSAYRSRAINFSIGMLLVASIAACGSGNPGQAIGVAVAPAATTQAAMFVSATASVPNVATAVTLTPAFSTDIHDYIVNCGGSTTINVTFTLPGNVSLGLVEPDGTTMAPTTYPSGQFAQPVAIAPGQRFQFSLSGESDNYSVRCVPSDFPTLSVSHVYGSVATLVQHQEPIAPQGQWYVFSPSLNATPGAAPTNSYIIVTDSNGTPVWWKNEPTGLPVDAEVFGPNQIGWWVDGAFYIRDFTGNLVHTITIAGGLDVHDLQLTPQGTYLAIQTVNRICPPDCADMSPWGGGAAMGVQDAQIVEIDQSNNVLWTWRTRDHIALSETGEEGWFPTVGNDIIHMNAISPDGSDAVVFSARHLNALYRITKSTGAIDWKIGGSTTAESLTVTGDTRPTALGPKGQVLSGQHDVRVWPDGTVSVHDNGTIANRPPFVMRYQIDTASRTASVVEEFSDVRVSFSGCCGSARRLPGGHWVVNWGEAQFFTEMVSEVPILTVQYATNGTFSYRAPAVVQGIISAATLRNGMDAMAATTP